jgi:VWFA-related protein
LITFSQAVRPRIPLSGDFDVVRAALQQIEPKGQTSLIDGVFVALASTLGQPGRSLVVVCTDGSDTFSWLQPSEVVAVARRSNAVVYAVTAADTKRPEALKQIAEATGGRLLPVKSSGELRTTFERILAEFRRRYVLAYVPEGVAPGGFHRIEVTVPRRKVTIAARPGYTGAESGGAR